MTAGGLIVAELHGGPLDGDSLHVEPAVLPCLTILVPLLEPVPPYPPGMAAATYELYGYRLVRPLLGTPRQIADLRYVA